MAGDILLYNADYVPVGEDQRQHLELTRDLADRFNNRYGDTFVVPKGYKAKAGAKIMSLIDPTKKMSKSEENPQGTIILLDDINVIRKKIMGATTDSEMRVVYDEENKPGISNLINIASSLSDYSKEDIEKMFEGKNYGEFKRFVADIVCEEIGKIQDKYNEIINSSLLDEILDEGLENSRKLAKEKYDLLREKVGLVR
jgi:tryptophanyl-tRNA synthetase